tara:strand:+ start:3824 stop:5023 length:1200 start_codon:yes stop_codon:yes gene_type:complete
MKRLTSLLTIAITVLLYSCGGEESQSPVVEVTSRDHVMTVSGRGELMSAESVPVNLPDGVVMYFNIAWLIPEYSQVKAGQVVARFDDSDVENQRAFTQLEVINNNLQLSNFERSNIIDRAVIDQEAARVDGEAVIARTFTEVDPRLFSQNEIIDALGDLDYLTVEEAYYHWQADTHAQRSKADRDRILSNRSSSELRLEKQNSALELMELRSPVDGTFIYAKTPWGQKLAKGQQVFAGRPVGMIPVKGKVKARIYVTEVDAVGLAAGQAVTLRIDTSVTTTHGAVVRSVSPVAVPRERDDPQKYFVIDADLLEVDEHVMRVGSSIDATITTYALKSVLLAPQQSVFYRDNQAYVQKIESGRRVDAPVELGQKSANLVVVMDGLDAGDLISVAPKIDSAS